MDIKDFSTEVKAAVSEKMGYEYVVDVEEITKNNGIVVHGLCILNRQVNFAPYIYLEPYYESLQSGAMSMETIVEVIVQVYKEHKIEQELDGSFFTDYEKARQHLRGQLINTEKNEQLLETVPHREFLDLSLIYTADYINEADGGVGSIRVTNRHMTMWKVDEDELFRQTQENMERPEEIFLGKMLEVLEKVIGAWTLEPENENMEKVYVLSNKMKFHGAVQMLNRNVLEKTAEQLGKDLLILPSSIHEVLVIPAKGSKKEVEEICEIVRMVNATQLSNEILSYHVYRYSRETGEITIEG